MRESLPSFFGFEAVGVLMYNFQGNEFFTDPDTSKDEKKDSDSGKSSGSDEEDEGDVENMSVGSGDAQSPVNFGESKNSMKKKEKKQKPVNYHKEDPLTEEQKAQRIRAIHSKTFMVLPTNSGISGAVFKSKELYYSNNASKETKFVEEIDNRSVCTDVKNFMIGPVFGTLHPNVPCAIIQFINKLDGQDK